MAEKKYYFAYGSNMDLEQMKRRCPNSEFVKVAKLEGYQFVYDGYSSIRKGAVANIVKKEDSIVYGALFKISDEDEEKLDKYEGYPNFYDKKTVKAKDKEGNEYDAFVYYREPKEEGFPSKEYENIVVSAAYKLNLPKDYIDKYLKKNK
ncbi:MAG: hypothetical protein KatS3mg095_0001 [Candidatus Parcubacteria bacterium]|nr:MAG: hypothetical protein KatS3mg094_001 [Candidatus Parcubacteria bacterium]GIW66103.1 MAG: hypothetical protein KatS3mg095_0001 [Candidatus Parcubacteria bacterium]